MILTSLDVFVLLDALLFFGFGLFFLTWLGIGINARLQPRQLQPYNWLTAPYYGYAFLVVICGLVVSFGGTTRIAVSISLTITTVINTVILLRSRSLLAFGTPRYWLLIPTLSLPLYSLSAITMSHNGSLACVSGNLDPYLLIPLAEWLKDHPAPTFALSQQLLDPYWNASVPPIGSWLDSLSHLDYARHRTDDSNFLFQRGSRYFEASIGLLLGWDSYLVLRPAQAFMLALSLPGLYLLYRNLFKSNIIVSLLATLLVSLNGTVFFWVSLIHPGQAAGIFLFPLTILVVLISLVDREKSSMLSAALLLAGVIVSYYNGVPLLPFLVLPPLVYLAYKSERWSNIIARSVIIGCVALILTFPEQVKLVLVLLNGTLEQTSGWGNPGFAPLGDAFGTSIQDHAFDAVVGKGQITDFPLACLITASKAATVVAILFALIGIAFGKASSIQLYRCMLCGAVILLAYLRIYNYPYGYTKAQTTIVFLLMFAVALGMEKTLVWTRSRLLKMNKKKLLRQSLMLPTIGMGSLLLVTVIMINLAIAAYNFWKPVGNIWNPKSWEATDLGEILSPGENVTVSPNILADPEAIWMVLYFLRNQHLCGTFAIEQTLGDVTLFTGKPQECDTPAVTILGGSEIAAARGLLPTDQIWDNNIINAYRDIEPNLLACTELENSPRLPARLPSAPRLLVVGPHHSKGSIDTNLGHLIITLAVESPINLVLSNELKQLSLRLGKGISICSIPTSIPGETTLSWTGDRQPWLISSVVRTKKAQSIKTLEEYPKVLFTTGESSTTEHEITTRIIYFNVKVPVTHSIDVMGPIKDSSSSKEHIGWFKLPTNPDETIRSIQVTIKPATLEHKTTVDGIETSIPSSIRQPPDGKYVAYFTIWSGSNLAKRIPLYQYRLEKQEMVDFEPFSLSAVWDGDAMSSN